MKPLSRSKKELYHYIDDKKISGKNPGMSGDCSGLRGNCSWLYGDCSGLYGDCSGLYGDCSGLDGDCSGLKGDIDKISIESREENCNINFYVGECNEK